MKKYRTGGWGKDPIEEVEVIKETPKQYVIESTDGRGKKYETRVNKSSSYAHYHDTWEDAHAYLLQRAERSVENRHKALEQAKDYLGNIKGMKKP